MGTSPGSSSGPESGRRPCPGTPQQSRPPRPWPPGRRPMRLPGASIFLFRHHAERRGRSGRTHADPPICTVLDRGRAAVAAAHNGIFCMLIAVMAAGDCAALGRAGGSLVAVPVARAAGLAASKSRPAGRARRDARPAGRGSSVRARWPCRDRSRCRSGDTGVTAAGHEVLRGDR